MVSGNTMGSKPAAKDTWIASQMKEIFLEPNSGELWAGDEANGVDDGL